MDPNWFKCGSGFVYGSGSRVLMTKNFKNFTSESKSNFFDQNLLFCSSLGPHKGRPSYRWSLHPSKENIQHFKTWNLFTLFYFLWDIFALLNPDPDAAGRPESMRIRIHNTGETRGNPAMQVQHKCTDNVRLQSRKHILFIYTVVRYPGTLVKGETQHLGYRF